jgi:hypothetical protein
LSMFWLLLIRQLVHDVKYPPCPRWFFLSSTTPLTSFHRKLVHVMDAICYPACVMTYLEVLLSFMSRMLWGLLHLLEILGISDTSRHHHSFLVPVLIITGTPMCKRCCLDPVLLATLLLWSYWSTVRS